MAEEQEVILWRAPSVACRDPAGEIHQGFDDTQYRGDGPYFATNRTIAEDFERCYENGIQEIHLSRAAFDTLVARGVIKPDGYYPEGQSWHIPPEGFAAFNESIRSGLGSRYIEQS